MSENDSFAKATVAEASKGLLFMAPSAKKNYLGDIVYRNRLSRDLTQDEYGARYDVSGPAIFKFEKGYLRPSLQLWLKLSKDAEITERRAVLLWLKSRLPERYQEYVELQGAVDPPGAERKGKGSRGGQDVVDYSKFEERAHMAEAAANDKSLPKALRDLLDDNELWSLYRPTGHEINLLRDMFGALGRGSKNSYREALRLIRMFTHSF